jgi:hypothetical protein
VFAWLIGDRYDMANSDDDRISSSRRSNVKDWR